MDRTATLRRGLLPAVTKPLEVLETSNHERKAKNGRSSRTRDSGKGLGVWTARQGAAKDAAGSITCKSWNAKVKRKRAGNARQESNDMFPNTVRARRARQQGRHAAVRLTGSSAIVKVPRMLTGQLLIGVITGMT